MKGNGIQYGKITVTGAAGRRGKEQGMKENGVIQEYTGSLSRQIREEYHIGEEYYHGEIKRGLRNSDGTGVMVGVTKVGSVQGYLLQDGQRIPIPGRLYYRGIELNDIVEAHRAEGTFGFEEVAYLLLMGYLPSQGELRHFNEIMNRARKLPEGFTEGMIMRRTSGNIMNELGRSILSLYSYDPDPDDLSVDNLLRQSVELIGYFPSIVANAYAVKRHHFGGESLHIHYPEEGLSTAENFLRMIRPDKSYTEEEAHLLDMMLMLHAEHGGGNNSTFTTHVVTSSGTDTYSAIASALGSLKGPKHGGANIMVVRMFEDLKQTIKDWRDEEEISRYLTALLHREAFDRAGLIYGMGHAVYSLSDPRANIMESFVQRLSEAKGRGEEYALYATVARLAPQIISRERRIYKGVSPNVDFYSGFVYSMLDLPLELYTPIFAIARIAGWSAHRIEELINAGKIIRPAYKSVAEHRDYVPLQSR